MNQKNKKREIRSIRFQFFFHLNLPIFNTHYSELEDSQRESLLKQELSDFIESTSPNFSDNDIAVTLKTSFETLSKRDILDNYIKTYCPKWKPERLGRVDYTLLTMAFHELKFEDTPHKVVINESIELAKKFGHKETPQFINGILDEFYKKEIQLKKEES